MDIITKDDYKAVLAINHNEYEGLDYVPAMYKSFISHPNAMAFILEINNIVVSLLTLSVPVCRCKLPNTIPPSIYTRVDSGG